MQQHPFYEAEYEIDPGPVGIRLSILVPAGFLSPETEGRWLNMLLPPEGAHLLALDLARAVAEWHRENP